MLKINTFIETLTSEFSKHRNDERAKQQGAYLKNRFEFYGMRSPERREVQRPFLLKEYLPERKDAFVLVRELWKLPQRDFHYFAQELAYKYHRKFELDDIELFEYMVANNSWWDTVDYIAVKLMGAYFKKFPDQIEPHVHKWLATGNIWLQRSALLFQLKNKEEINKELMASTIQFLLGSKEFFINKAIGWVLREYSRTNPDWVLNFAEENKLSNLSRREAIRLIK